jgi:HTH-type transcriptional regulator, glycine betaine synthesis regulator
MSPDDIQEALAHVVDACVRSAKIKGFSDASGVLRGTLLLSPVPLSMDDLVERTGYSKSTVSSNMSILENIGFVKRLVTPGDKRYHYVAVTDLGTIKATMMNHVKDEVNLIVQALDQTEKDLITCGSHDEAILERITALRKSYTLFGKLIELAGKYTAEELIELIESHNRQG